VILTEITSLKWNGVPFLPRLQKHRKCKQNKGILDAPLASEMLNSIPTMWFLMNSFHFHENGRKTWESMPFRWNLAFWGQRGIKNTFVLLAFPMLLQQGRKGYTFYVISTKHKLLSGNPSFCRKRTDFRSFYHFHAKAEGATWRRTGPRPGPAGGPVWVCNHRIYWLPLSHICCCFLPILDFGGARGGPKWGPILAPPGPPPGGPKVTKSQEPRKWLKCSDFH